MYHSVCVCITVCMCVSQCVCITVCMCVSQCVCVSQWVYVSQCMCVYHSMCVSQCVGVSHSMCVYHSVCVSQCVCITVCVYHSVCVSQCVCITVGGCVSQCVCVSQWVCITVCVYHSVCLCIHMERYVLWLYFTYVYILHTESLDHIIISIESNILYWLVDGPMMSLHLDFIYMLHWLFLVFVSGGNELDDIWHVSLNDRVSKSNWWCGTHILKIYGDKQWVGL